MRLNVVDYAWASGGHSRFVIQMVKALRAVGLQDLRFVSHGFGLTQYKRLFREEGLDITCIDIPPRQRWFLDGFLGFTVSGKIYDDCDAVWFPWIRHHRIPFAKASKVIGSFHDGLLATDPGLARANPVGAREEHQTTKLWLESDAGIVCSSHYWSGYLNENFVHHPAHLHVVPLAGDHALADGQGIAAEEGKPQRERPFFLCPAGISSHKNHETLFAAYHMANTTWPLVLTGPGTDFQDRRPLGYRLLRRAAVLLGLRAPHRGGHLRRLVGRLNIRPPKAVEPLGYLSEGDYNSLLERAACVVVPTLGEGGGSFPVEEALQRGIPVICSDIPPIREHMSRIGAKVMWFDPHSPEKLAACMSEVESDYSAIKQQAVAQRAHLKTRTWIDVATDYAALFQAVRSAH